MEGDRSSQVRPSEATAWLAHLTAAFRDACADRHGREAPIITVLAANDGGIRLEVELRFRSGRRYCCTESQCHLGASRRWWQKVREHLRDVSDRDPPPISLSVTGVVEPGALFESHRSLGMPEASDAYTYAAQVREIEAR
jgi:hypothetical protein